MLLGVLPLDDSVLALTVSTWFDIDDWAGFLLLLDAADTDLLFLEGFEVTGGGADVLDG
jgi:hypothetical protein